MISAATSYSTRTKTKTRMDVENDSLPPPLQNSYRGNTVSSSHVLYVKSQFNMVIVKLINIVCGFHLLPNLFVFSDLLGAWLYLNTSLIFLYM